MAKEKIVQVVDDAAEGEDRGEDPEESVSERVEDERRGAEAKGEARIEEKETQPVKAEERPLGRTDGAKAESVLDVNLGQEGSGAGVKHEGDGIVEGTV